MPDCKVDVKDLRLWRAVEVQTSETFVKEIKFLRGANPHLSKIQPPHAISIILLFKHCSQDVQ